MKEGKQSLTIIYMNPYKQITHANHLTQRGCVHTHTDGGGEERERESRERERETGVQKQSK